MSKTMLTMANASWFQVAKWYRHPWVWFLRLIGRGEVILINNEPHRIKKVVDGTTLEIK